jgi:hypothetical protein
MIIRSEQFDRMDELIQGKYYEEVRRFLREKVPQLVERLSDGALVSRIAEATSIARKSGVQTSEGLLAYIGLSMAAGHAFNRDSKVREFLFSNREGSDARIEWLYQRVVESLIKHSTPGNPGAEG